MAEKKSMTHAQNSRYASPVTKNWHPYVVQRATQATSTIASTKVECQLRVNIKVRAPRAITKSRVMLLCM